MPRLVRRQPILERIKSALSPLDFLLWLSEEIESSDWDQLEKNWAAPLGFGLNFVFLIARTNCAPRSNRTYDDVFGDDSNGVSLTSWFASFVVHSLTLFCAINTFYTFWRKRRYRLFEASIDNPPPTPSAHRVPVSSSPLSASPAQYLTNMLSGANAESRRHPDPSRDVWEIAVWDPFPLSLRLFCSFSPGHVLVYWLFLPTLPSDPRPSGTIFTTILLAVLLTMQMSFLSKSFSRRAKDSTLIHKEVMNEYDTKFVQPRTHPLMRDVGVQFSGEHISNPDSDAKYNIVELYTPTHIINRGFRTSPNPNYLGHVDPDFASSTLSSPTRPQSSMFSNFQTTAVQTPTRLRDSSPGSQKYAASRTHLFRTPGNGTGDGGSLGVYSHANSPLRKSMSAIIDHRNPTSAEIALRERMSSPGKRPLSPLKQPNTPSGPGTPSAKPRWTHISNTPRRESGFY
ncbi:hypothetical protein VTN31DRAFT_3056 [Thermomyces dupontii]|uniref:uncharacterized protein n=1 Tax=Talaromyces thermophilus TaxID=28565 RepID=UPI003743517C